MELWTWHTPDFDLVGGEIDHSKSRFYNYSQSIRDAYAELERRIGTNKLVWCFTTQKAAETWHEDGRKCWLLSVPDEKVRHIDDYIWNRIIKSPYVPRTLEHEWELAAMRGGLSVAEATEEFHSRIPDVALWDRLSLDSTASGVAEEVSAVVEHPLQPHWVVRRLNRRGRKLF